MIRIIIIIFNDFHKFQLRNIFKLHVSGSSQRICPFRFDK